MAIDAAQESAVNQAWDAIVRQVYGKNPFSFKFTDLLSTGSDSNPTFGNVTANTLALTASGVSLTMGASSEISFPSSGYISFPTNNGSLLWGGGVVLGQYNFAGSTASTVLAGVAGDGAGQIAVAIVASPALSTSGTQVCGFFNGTTEVAYIDHSGNISGNTYNAAAVSFPAYSLAGTGALFLNGGSGALTVLRGQSGSGTTNIALDTAGLFTTGKLVSIRNNTSEVASFDHAGALAISGALTIPDGASSIVSSPSTATFGFNSGTSTWGSPEGFILGGSCSANGLINSGVYQASSTVQAGTSYAPLSVTFETVFMTDDAIRTVTLPGATNAGTRITIVDTSGSVTAGHTITVSAASGSIKSGGAATAIITPGVSGSLTVVSDGTNYWITAKI